MKKNSEKTEKNHRILPLLLAVFLLGVAFYSFNAEKLTGNLMPMPFGFGVSVVLSNSMKPVLTTGDVVLVEKTDDLAVGDIIVYQSGHTLTVHRLIGIDGETLTTKGDANNAADTPFQEDCVKGKVLVKVPGAGYLIQAMKTPLGTLLVTAAAVFLLESSYRSERKRSRAEISRLTEELEQLKSAQAGKKESSCN